MLSRVRDRSQLNHRLCRAPRCNFRLFHGRNEMESIAALGLASNIIQLVDFSARVLSRSHEIYTSSDGTLKDYNILNTASKNLTALLYNFKDLIPVDSRQQTTTDLQLLELTKRSERLAHELQALIQKTKAVDTNRRWKSAYQALKSIASDRQLTALKDQLEQLRREVDTTLLSSLRYAYPDDIRVESIVIR